MIDHQVQDDFHLPLRGFSDKEVHIRHGAKGGVNGIIIYDIILVI